MSEKTSDAAEILDIEFGDDPAYQQMLDEERVKSQAARAIYEARTAAGLTQKQLAALVGTNQSVISRLEDTDYDRHSLAMLERIGRALNKRLEIHYVSRESSARKVARVRRVTGVK
jgi:ribosome-binding protein aMBF1 (putative translation factor)